MKKRTKRREWTTQDVRELKSLARQKMPVGKIAKSLKRTLRATQRRRTQLVCGWIRAAEIQPLQSSGLVFSGPALGIARGALELIVKCAAQIARRRCAHGGTAERADARRRGRSESQDKCGFTRQWPAHR